MIIEKNSLHCKARKVNKCRGSENETKADGGNKKETNKKMVDFQNKKTLSDETKLAFAITNIYLK